MEPVRVEATTMEAGTMEPAATMEPTPVTAAAVAAPAACFGRYRLGECEAASDSGDSNGKTACCVSDLHVSPLFLNLPLVQQSPTPRDVALCDRWLLRPMRGGEIYSRLPSEGRP